MKKTILTSLFFLSTIYVSLGQNTDLKIDTVVYKKVDTVTLVMKVIYPPSMDKSKKYPGMVYLKHNLNARAIASLQSELGSIEADVSRLIKEMEVSIAEADRFISALKQN